MYYTSLDCDTKLVQTHTMGSKCFLLKKPIVFSFPKRVTFEYVPLLKHLNVFPPTRSPIYPSLLPYFNPNTYTLQITGVFSPQYPLSLSDKYQSNPLGNNTTTFKKIIFQTQVQQNFFWNSPTSKISETQNFTSPKY